MKRKLETIVICQFSNGECCTGDDCPMIKKCFSDFKNDTLCCSNCGSDKVYLLSDSHNYYCPECQSLLDLHWLGG